MFSYWEKESYFAKQQIIIIGAGFVGLWSAIALAEQHPTYKITILDKGILPTGASTKNAGFSCFGSPTELLNDAEMNGENTMWQMVEKRYKGIAKIHATINPNLIQYSNSGGYECLDTEDTIKVNNKLAWLNKGIKYLTNKAETFTYCNNKLQQLGLQNFAGLISNSLEGALQPALLLQQLTQKAQSLGIQIIYNSGVSTIENNNNVVTLYTTNNIKLCTERVLVCTNGFVSTLLPQIAVMPCRGQVCITEPISNLALNGCFHYKQGYYYFRNVGERILIGGARNTDWQNENTDELVVTDSIQNALQLFLQKHFVTTTPITIAMQWSGIMGFTNNHTPIVKEVTRNIYCAVGMNGMGVALAPIIADEVAALMK